jgi:hypothetical protein
MKRIALISVAIIFIALCGCGKNKDCRCVTSAPGKDDMVSTFDIDEGTCSQRNETFTINGVTYTKTCKEQ